MSSEEDGEAATRTPRPPTRRRAAGLVLAALALGAAVGARTAAAPPEPAPAWEPAKTWAVLIGVLEWANPGFPPFPKEGRVDRVLEKALAARGVRPDRTTFLEDGAATLAACRSALTAAAKGAAEGDTLVFYYAGHGWNDGDGRTFFAPYDVDGERPETALSVAEIGDVMRKEFHGSRLLLLADCCHSGALGRIAEPYGKTPAVKAGAITSALEDITSTANWTYTQSMVAVLSGDGGPDVDGDRATSFQEADAYVRREMRFREGQPTVARVGGMEPNFVLARVDPARVAKPLEGGRKVGEYVEVQIGEDWTTAEVVGAAKGRVLVRRLDQKRAGEWIEAAKVQPPRAISVRPGDAVEVEWRGRWWPAGVRRTLDDFARVHYQGFSIEWDEWVLPPRIRPRP